MAHFAQSGDIVVGDLVSYQPPHVPQEPVGDLFALHNRARIDG